MLLEKLQLEKERLLLKKTAPKNLAIKNKLLSNVVQGLKELGKDNVDYNVREKIKIALEKIPIETLKEEIVNAPVWIRNEVSLLQNEKI